MATWGALNNTNEENSATDGPRFSGGVFGAAAGTLTDVNIFIGGFSLGSTFRVGVYQGGIAGNPTGATLIYDSGLINGPTTTPRAWRSLVTDYSKTPSGSLAASTRTWIFIKNLDGTVGLSNADDGDFDQSAERSTMLNDPTVAFLSTVGTDAGTTSSETLKAYLTFTSVASVPPLPQWIPRVNVLTRM